MYCIYELNEELLSVVLVIAAEDGLRYLEALLE
jgi:hypothetical protein